MFLLLSGCAEPQSVVETYLDAVVLRELGQNELAVEKLKAVVELDPEFAMAYSELGKAYAALGQHEQAATALQNAVRLDPWSLEDYLSLGNAYRQMGKSSPAAKAYARAAELDGQNLQALTSAAECYLAAGEPLRALTYCESAQQAGAKPQKVLPLLARIYEAQADHEQAIRTYRQWLALDAEDLDAWLSLGLACMRAGQYENACEALTSATRIQPHDGRAFRYLGYCMIKRDRIEQGVEMYKRALDLDSDDWEAHRGLGVAYMVESRRRHDGRLEALAVQHWRRSLDIYPGQPKRKTLEKLIRQHAQTSDVLQGLDY